MRLAQPVCLHTQEPEVARVEPRPVAHRLELDLGRSGSARDLDDPVVTVARHQRVEQQLVGGRKQGEYREPGKPQPGGATEFNRRFNADRKSTRLNSSHGKSSY